MPLVLPTPLSPIRLACHLPDNLLLSSVLAFSCVTENINHQTGRKSDTTEFSTLSLERMKRGVWRGGRGLLLYTTVWSGTQN